MKTSVNWKELIAKYDEKKYLIRRRLRDFRDLHRSTKDKIFPELCFCLLTPQSNARHCDKAIQELKKKNLLSKGGAPAIRPILKGRARFHNKKADYIVGARRCFDKDILSQRDVRGVREYLVKNIRGIGYKEASHFLRNIGLGKDIAILDRHILKNLKRYGAIRSVPSTLTPKIYLGIEAKAQEFSRRIGIPLEDLDLLFWSNETGEIFK